MANEPKTTAERDHPKLPTPVISYYDEMDKKEVNCFSDHQMHAYYDLGREAGVREALAASPTAQAAPAAGAGPLDELSELSMLNRLIELGNKAAGFHATSNSDDGPKGTTAYVQWQETRAEIGDLIRSHYAAVSQPPAEAQEPAGELCPSCRNGDLYACTCTHPAPQQAVPQAPAAPAEPIAWMATPVMQSGRSTVAVFCSDKRMALQWDHGGHPEYGRMIVTGLAPVAAPVAEGDALSQHHRDSWELRRLCEARDEARRERDAARKNESAALDLLSRMRFACGDNGKRMQDELELYLRALQASHERYNYLTRAMGEYCVARADEYTGGVLKAGAADTAIDAARAQAKEGGGNA